LHFKLHYLKLIFFITCILSFQNFYCQNDSSEILVTATRSQQNANKVAVPYSLISKNTISLTGSLKLNNILSEQTGLVIVSNFGAGLQMQGLSADYTLILLNGEPLVGRNGGTLDLSRVVLGNILRIEIVKGPFSSLYGSEALGGVINIITDQKAKNSWQANLRYGSNKTFDANASLNKSNKKTQQQFFSDYNSTAGYSFNSNQVGQTADPFFATTLQYNIQHTINKKHSFASGLKYFYEKQKNAFDAGVIAGLVNGNRIRKDFSFQPSYTFKASKKVTFLVRGYYTNWVTNQKLVKTQTLENYYDDAFNQQFARIENQTNLNLATNQTLTIGGGAALDVLITNRYNETKKNTNAFFFAQHVFDVSKKLNIVSGFRFDYNKAFKATINPKFAIKYNATKKWSINGSIGSAFKAPDFRQMYLNFNNSVAGGGYTVFGANETSLDNLLTLQSQGFITSLLSKAYQLANLKPESSLGINIGADFKLNKNIKISINGFRNYLTNLIEFEPIAIKPNNAFIYSYFNKSKAFTQGLETNINVNTNIGLNISAGYQYLNTGDVGITNSLKAKTIYTRSADGEPARLLKPNEYLGLFNRSKHNANIKLFVPENNSKWSGSIRCIYRSAWGTVDRDGNGIANKNRADEYAKGYVSFNTLIQRNITTNFQVMLGVDNIGNYKDIINLPNIPGRTYFISIQIKQKDK
jgi:outer membrane receptor for ferrienterochelin and colicins